MKDGEGLWRSSIFDHRICSSSTILSSTPYMLQIEGELLGMWGRVVGASASAPPPLGQNQGGSRIAWRPVSKPLMQCDHISVWLSLPTSLKRGLISFAGPSTWNAFLLAWSPLTLSSLGWNATASGRPSLPPQRKPPPSLSLSITRCSYAICLLLTYST